MDLSPRRIEEIRAYMNKLELEPSMKELLNIRWLDTIKDYEEKAARDVRRYRIFYLVALVAGLLIPVITNIDSGVLSESAQDIIVSILGVITALAAGLNQLINYRKRWAFYREQSHLIKQEGFAFLSLTNQYKGSNTHKEAFRAFFGNLERIITESLSGYQDFFDTDEENSMNVSQGTSVIAGGAAAQRGGVSDDEEDIDEEDIDEEDIDEEDVDEEDIDEEDVDEEDIDEEDIDEEDIDEEDIDEEDKP